MPPLVLAAILTALYGFMAWIFLRQRREGVIRTGMGDVSRLKSPRRYAALDCANIVMFAVAGLILVLLWTGAI